MGLDIEYDRDGAITGLGLRCVEPTVQVKYVSTSPVVAASEQYRAMEKDIRVKVDKDGTTATMSIDAAIARHEVNGATVVIISGGAIAGTYHYGLRNKKDKLPTTRNTLYQAASTSKFVAALAMTKAARMSAGPNLGRRVRETAQANPGSLLDTWVHRKFGKSTEKYLDEITVRRLLGHTAGLEKHLAGTSPLDSTTDMRRILLGGPTTDGMDLNGIRPETDPGTLYLYSSGNYVIAEAMLEQHTGRTAREFLNNEILEPYNMSKSTFNQADADMMDLARGCSREPCLYDVLHTEVKFPGGLLALPEDYARVLTYVLNDGKDAQGKPVIPMEDLIEIMTPQYHIRSSRNACSATRACAGSELCFGAQCLEPIAAGSAWYGLGVDLSKERFGEYSRYLSHSGGQPGFSAYFSLDRLDKNGIVIMVNGSDSWNKKDVEYGAHALRTDIYEAFKRAYRN